MNTQFDNNPPIVGPSAKWREVMEKSAQTEQRDTAQQPTKPAPERPLGTIDIRDDSLVTNFRLPDGTLVNGAYILGGLAQHDQLQRQLKEMASAVKDYGSQVLQAHIRDLGETPRNKRYQDSIREDIAAAAAILAEKGTGQ